MSKASVRKHVLERNSSSKGLSKEKGINQKEKHSNSFLFKQLKRVYPLGIRRSDSLLSVSSLSLSDHTSTDSSLTDFPCPLDQKILLSLESLHKVVLSISPPRQSEGTEFESYSDVIPPSPRPECEEEKVKRCHWITNSSDKAYVSFHDEQWGAPVYDDNQLFELLSMSGLLMDYSWTEILKKRCQLREAFGGFDVKMVAKMEDREIEEMWLNKDLTLAECRTKCIVENAKRILKVAKEYGSFSSYIWGYFNYRPIINKYRFSRNVPLRTPKAEAISKDLVRQGFRLVGPVITQSFIQAAGMTIDHLVDCYRYDQCVSLAENPWRHV